MGAYFLEGLFSEIDSLLHYAGIHGKVYGYHRLIVRRFPYAVYYKMEHESLVLSGGCWIFGGHRQRSVLRSDKANQSHQRTSIHLSHRLFT